MRFSHSMENAVGFLLFWGFIVWFSLGRGGVLQISIKQQALPTERAI